MELTHPLVRKLDRNFLHPIDYFPAFEKMAYPILLDSSAQHKGRYSYLTADPFLVLLSHGSEVTIEKNNQSLKSHANVLGVLQDLLLKYKLNPSTEFPNLPGFQGGAAGFMSYDLSRLLEDLPVKATWDHDVPDLALPFYDWVIAYDNILEQSYLFSTGFPTGTKSYAFSRIKWVLDHLDQNKENVDQNGTMMHQTSSLSSTFSRTEYHSAVNTIKEYLHAGDTYQVNISHRFECEFTGNEWSLYKNLREANPAPFGAYLKFPMVQILSSSPEQFLSLDGTFIETRPIKGTKPRGDTQEIDTQMAKDLFNSNKDRAENIMIVDLLRNDLGKVCTVGSVKVPSLFSLEAHPTVWHLVSTITGCLAPRNTVVDLIRATFPGGSITGTPKIRAMEIIEDIEPVRRQVYCGSIGYISFTGNMKTNIAIRTIVIKNGRVYLPVGGGIVADSDPETEYQETLDKSKGILRTLGQFLNTDQT